MTKVYDLSKDLDANIIGKNKFARILASENIYVEHEKTDVPMFDIKDRVLILPIWNNYTEALLDRVIGHEVAHAIYTPRKEFLELVDDPKNKADKEFPIFMQFLNIVEDIRIEKHIIRRYPGILGSFVKSCKDFIDRDYFGIKKHNKDIKSLNVADRVNLFFKLNVYDEVVKGLEFSDEEKEMVSKLAKVETWQEAVDLAKELMEFCKQQQPEMFDKMFYNMQKGKDGNGKEQYVIIMTQEEFDKAKKDNSHGKGNAVVIVQGGQPGQGQSQPGQIDTKGLPHIIIDDNNRKQIQQAMNKAAQQNANSNNQSPTFINSAGVSSGDPAAYVVPYKQVMSKYSGRTQNVQWNTFTTEVKMFLSSMIMEFERKKKAAVWKTRQKSLTGELDMNSLFKYQMTDEIFKMQTKVKQGKNHTIVLFLDLSGSMSNTIHNVVKQLYLMTLFCRKAGIKHVVYGFTDGMHDVGIKQNPTLLKGRNTLRINPNFRLVELFNYTMKEKEFTEQADKLYACYSGGGVHNPYLTLNGTPLNDTLILANQLLPAVKAAHKSDIMNVILMTDGDSNYSEFFSKWSGQTLNSIYSNNNNGYFINSEFSGKTYKVGNTPYDITLALVNLLKSDHGIRMINFHIGNEGYLRRYAANNHAYNEAIATFKRDKKVGLFGKNANVWDGIIVSTDSMLGIKSASEIKSTKSILQLVVDLVS